ncbi:MAG: transposase [Methylococcales bacterium]|nr:transposase [Methylococcales bacterium]
MNIHDRQAETNAIYQAIAQMESSEAQDIVKKIFNLIERLASDKLSLETELQQLRDEVNRLKGEQGKPDIKPNKNNKGDDISSEDERKKAQVDAQKETNNDTENTDSDKKKRRRKPKIPRVKIDQTLKCLLDKTGLPSDLVSKGFAEVVIQDIVIKTNNIKYLREIFYSPSENKYYRAQLPEGVRGQGEFGIGIRSLIPMLKMMGVTEKPMVGFFENIGIVVSPTYVSQQWTGGYDWAHQEKSELYRSGILNSDYGQIDDTSARVNGDNHYCQVVCNDLFTAYFTTKHKNRLSVLDVLTDYAPRHYIYNQQAQSLLDEFKLADKARAKVDAQIPVNTVMNEAQFKLHLAILNTLGVRQATHVTEACAIAYYQQQTDFPVIETLLADDAPQFKLLTEHLGLCWIHDARHYKKLRPILEIHQQALADFRGLYWEYYKELLNYQKNPCPDKKAWLLTRFDELFATTSDYEDLNDRIAKTLAKKTELLRVLELPKLPLHNNAAELGARRQARARDISFQTRNEKGTKIKDSFMSLAETAKKLAVSFYDYVYDRVSGEFKMPSMANLIAQKAQSLQV